MECRTFTVPDNSFEAACGRCVTSFSLQSAYCGSVGLLVCHDQIGPAEPMVPDHGVDHFTAVNTSPRERPYSVDLSHVEKPVPYHEPFAAQTSHINLRFPPLRRGAHNKRSKNQCRLNKISGISTLTLPPHRCVYHTIIKIG
jgi:hypothetical protein